MRRNAAGLSFALALTLVTPAWADIPVQTWTFEEQAIGSTLQGFLFARTGSGRPGHWVIVEDEGSEGRHVVTQSDPDVYAWRYLLALAPEPSVKDASVSMRCKILGGTVRQACGLAFRYQNEEDYYVVRVDALEQTIDLMAVRGGHPRLVEQWGGSISPNIWHALRVDMQADRIQVFWNNARVIDARDWSYQRAGRFGLWTQADSRVVFDRLRVAPLF